jgi:hypothetical protein
VFHFLSSCFCFLPVTDIDPFDFEAPRSSLIALIDWKIETIYQPFGFQKFSLGAPSKQNSHQLNIPDLSCVEHLSLHGLNHSSPTSSADDQSMEIVSSDLAMTPPSQKSFQSSKIHSLDTFVQEISAMLFHLSHHLSASPSLYTKLCRLFKIRLESSQELSAFDPSQVSVDLNDTHGSEVVNIYRIISSVLLPSLTRIDCNPAISALCWAVISQFPFNARFTMYGIWKGEGLGKQVRQSPFQSTHLISCIL